jgi:hypothetical protein|tara:strand:+ start:62 stop:625 length:564 start_codon:yes stop_codon:yes gene_type:complete
MKSIPTAVDIAVLKHLEKTYPDFKLCSYENLGRLNYQQKIMNPYRFWNERSREVIKSIHEINVTLHRFPDKHIMKIIASPTFESLFFSQVFPYLEKKIHDTKKPNPEEMVMMIKLCDKFLKIGLEGMKQTMPDEFQQLLQVKYDEFMSLMQAINQHSKKLSPNEFKKTEFTFDLHTKKKVTKKNKPH